MPFAGQARSHRYSGSGFLWERACPAKKTPTTHQSAGNLKT